MWGLLIFLVGLAYGWLSPGRQQKGRLLMGGIWIGLVLAIVFALLGVLVDYGPLAMEGAVGMFLSVMVLTLLFVLGVWLGDLIEGMRGRSRAGVH